jgi:hypothetical protein
VLKKPRTIEQDFWRAIKFGAFAAILVVGTFALSTYENWAEQTDKQPACEQGSGQPIPAWATPEPCTTTPNQSASQQGGGNNAPTFWDIRFTDIAVVLFTYCLVVVGYFTMKSSEKTVRDIERAQVSFSWSPTPGTKTPAGDVTVEYGIANAGKTRAFLHKAYIDFLADPPAGNTPTYPQTASCIIKNTAGVFPPSSAYGRVNSIQFNITATPIIVGYFIFTDVFDRWFVSRFCARLNMQTMSLDMAGSPEWNEDVEIEPISDMDKAI